MTVRAATEADYPALLEFSHSFYLTLPVQDIPFDGDSCRYWLDLMREGGVLLIAENQGMPAGMAGGLFAPSMFNKNYTVGIEVMWWIDPQYRSLGLGLNLISALENAAYSRGAVRWSMVATEDTSERVGRIYDRLGYVPCERTYSKVPEWRSIPDSR